MRATLHANGLPIFVGSLPIESHEEASDWVFEYTPQIPLWIQLPAYPTETMVIQFMPGLPGFRPETLSARIDTDADGFEQELVEFYEEYLAVHSGEAPLENSRFALREDVAGGFSVFQKRLQRLPAPPLAVKGQITGPFTFCTTIHDNKDRAIFYNEQLRDAAVKLLAGKAAWQVRQLAGGRCPVIMFIDEPGLAGFGSSEFISISPQDVQQCLAEVVGAVQSAGALAGVHVCANTDWSLILDSGADILSFDAYSFFDKLVLYQDALKRFIAGGGILSWGIVPTSKTQDIERETVESLFKKFRDQILELELLGFDRDRILSQSLISTSCGTGSISRQYAERVLKMTSRLSAVVRKEFLQHP